MIIINERDLKFIRKCIIATLVFWSGSLLYNILWILGVIIYCKAF